MWPSGTGEGLVHLHQDPSFLLEKEQEQAGILVKEHQAREERKREIAMEKRRLIAHWAQQSPGRIFLL